MSDAQEDFGSLFRPEYGNRMAMPSPARIVSTSDVTAYDCPDRRCDALRVIPANTPVMAVAYINGEVVNAGQAIWYELADSGGYVYLDWFN